jgi:serine/threonine protein kinase
VKELDPEKLIFIGTEENNNRICVKFVRAYSWDAHKCLEVLECAPRLRGFEEIAGGWFMVVMDMLPDDFETLSVREKLPSSVFDDIRAKLKKFHEAGFVHGDIRDTNIMVSKSNARKFKIIDFDWAGKRGEARYPAGVNYVDIERPLEARDGKEILADHDLAMLKCIRRLKCNDSST